LILKRYTYGQPVKGTLVFALWFVSYRQHHSDQQPGENQDQCPNPRYCYREL